MEKLLTIAACNKIVEEHGGEELIVYGSGKWWEWLIDFPGQRFANTDRCSKTKREAYNDAAEFAKEHLKKRKEKHHG